MSKTVYITRFLSGIFKYEFMDTMCYFGLCKTSDGVTRVISYSLTVDKYFTISSNKSSYIDTHEKRAEANPFEQLGKLWRYVGPAPKIITKQYKALQGKTLDVEVGLSWVNIGDFVSLK